MIYRLCAERQSIGYVLRSRGTIYKLSDERKRKVFTYTGKSLRNGGASDIISDFLILGTCACFKVFILCVSACLLQHQLLHK